MEKIKKFKVFSMFFMILLFSTYISGSINIGQSLNNYTYENLFDTQLDFSVSTKPQIYTCDDYIYIIFGSGTGGNGGVGQYSYDGILIRNTTLPSYAFPLYFDCDVKVGYFMNSFYLGSVYLIAYDIESKLDGISPYITGSYDLGGTFDTTLSSYDIEKVGNKIYFSTGRNKTLYQFSENTLSLNNFEVLNENILDIEPEDDELYLLTPTFLYKFNSDLESDKRPLDVDFTTIAQLTSGGIDKVQNLIEYNNVQRRLFVWLNASSTNTILGEFDKDGLFLLKEINLSHSPFKSGARYYSNSETFFSNSRFYFIDSSNDVYTCDFNGNCINEISVNDFNNWNRDYSDLLINTIPLNFGKFNSYNNKDTSLFFIGNYTTGILKNYKVIEISGFQEKTLFDDSFTLNFMTINKTPEFVDNYIYVDVSATHQEDNDYLRYAITCYGESFSLYKQSFSKNTVFNETDNFNTICNYDLRLDGFGLNNYVIGLNNCSDGLLYESITKPSIRYSTIFSIGQVEDYNISLSLMVNETDSFINIIINYDDEILSFYNDGENESFYSVRVETSFTPLTYFNRIFYDVELLVDLSNNVFRIGTSSYGFNNFTYSDVFNLDYNTTSFYGYEIKDISNSDVFGNEFFGFELTNNNLPDFGPSNIKSCKYSISGSYLIKVYVSTEFNENYNTFVSETVEVLPYEPNDLGNAFDPLMTGYKSASFWKFIMFMAFTLSILVSVGFFDKENTTSSEIMFSKFLVFETFMLYVMSFFFNFFPYFYFITITIVDALVITFYLSKVWGGR